MEDKVKYTRIRRVDDIVVLRPRRDLLGDVETDELGELVTEFDTQGVRALVVNLADVSLVSSLGISAIVRGHVKFSRRNGRYGVCELTRRVESVFAIVRLCMAVPCFESEAKAIAAFKETTG